MPSLYDNCRSSLINAMQRVKNRMGITVSGSVEPFKDRKKRHGFDAPIDEVSRDYLDRENFARGIYRVVGEAPEDWSLRAAVFGRWGEGKTSVLELVYNFAKADSHVCIWMNAWDAVDAQSIWQQLAVELVAEAKARKIPINKKLKVQLSSTRLFDKFSGGMNAAAQAHDYAKAGVEFLAAVREFFNVKSEEIQLLRKSLGGKRVIVFLDDLDRADPHVVPQMLLSLREVLDLPQFSFLLALDLDVVTSALTEYHPGFTSGAEFLQKIIDFPFQMPDVTSRQRERLLNKAIAEYCPYVPNSAWDEIEDLVPNNPRQIKLLVRRVSTLRYEVDRHDADELDWSTILIGQLIRQESEVFLRLFIQEALVEAKFDLIGLFDRDGEHKETRKKLIEDILVKADIKNPLQRERLQSIVEKWRVHRVLFNVEKIHYQLTFSEHPHALTWKEYRKFLDVWELWPAREEASDWVTNHAMQQHVPIEKVANELFTATLTSYAAHLNRASESQVLGEQKAAVFNADKALTLLNTLYLASLDGLPETHFQQPENISGLFKQALQWAHFTKNESDNSARKREHQVLSEWLKALPDQSIALELLEPWTGYPNFRNEMQDKLRHVLAIEIEPNVVPLVVRQFSIAAGLQKVREQGKYEAIKYLLLRANSNLWLGEGRASIYSQLKLAAENQIVHKNAIEFLELLLHTAEQGSAVARREDAIELVKDKELLGNLWAAVTARAVQYRFLSSLRELKQKAVALGASDNWMTEPDWLKEVTASELADLYPPNQPE